LLIEASKPLKVRLRVGEVHMQPGRPVRFSEEDGRKLLARAPGKVRCVTPKPPLRAGWLVAYRDSDGRLRGGCDDRQAGTVATCQWDGVGWTIQLTSGEHLRLSRIASVAKTDSAGNILAAWTVREHGFNGEGPVTRGGQN
jgi:hypothetical protein